MPARIFLTIVTTHKGNWFADQADITRSKKCTRIGARAAGGQLEGGTPIRVRRITRRQLASSTARRANLRLNARNVYNNHGNFRKFYG